MFRGTKEEQKAATEELRQLAILARGMGSRLEMLMPHLAHDTKMQFGEQLKKHIGEMDTAADNLGRYYSLSVDSINESR